MRKILGNRYTFFSLTYLISWVTIFLSLTGVGFSIAEYMFNQVGVLDDLENGVLLSPAFYNSELLTLPNFAWIVSPIVNLLNYMINNIFATPNQLNCQVLGLLVECNTSVHLSVGGNPFLIPDSAVITWLAGSFFLFSWLIFKICKNLFLTILLSTSYPIVYALSRGNPDMLASIIVASLILSILSKKIMLSFILVGVLTAIKIPFGLLVVPLIFAFPKLKNLLMFILVTGLSYLIPLIVLSTNGSIFNQLQVFSTLVQRYNNQYAYYDAGLMHSTSLLSFFKVLFFYIGKLVELNTNLKTYIFAAFFVSSISVLIYTLVRIYPVLINLRRNKNPDLLIDCALIGMVLVIILPGVSQDYRFALLVPFLAFMFRKSENLAFPPPVVALLCILLMSKNFLQITFPMNTWGTTVGALINPIILLLLLQTLLNKFNKIQKLTV
jgi:hypothetical protein